MAQNATADELSTIPKQVDHIVDAGLLTERQAQAYVNLEVHDLGRYATADHYEIAATTLDDYLRAAKDKIEAAEETLDALDTIEDDEESRNDNAMVEQHE